MTSPSAPPVRIGDRVRYRGNPYIVTALLPASARPEVGRVVLVYCGAAAVPPEQQEVTVPAAAVVRC